MRSLRFVPLLVAAAGCAGGSVTMRPFPESEPLALAVPAAELSRIHVSGRDGRLDVRVGTTDTILVRVTLSRGCDPLGGYALRSSAAGSSLALRVEPTTTDACDERWTVEAPTRLAVQADMSRADVSIVGFRGGVDADLGNGTLTVDAPEGDLHAHVEKGDAGMRGALRCL